MILGDSIRGKSYCLHLHVTLNTTHQIKTGALDSCTRIDDLCIHIYMRREPPTHHIT